MEDGSYQLGAAAIARIDKEEIIENHQIPKMSLRYCKRATEDGRRQDHTSDTTTVPYQ